ncbi:hemicentin-1-like [Denticeps clupeoides]|uniref:hemicentin-1-like n=1 Tax=Denticeps clupeoides TaxID=299321 RepID=UPI0010A2C78F|nr:hemicentin-1-like [Denticeps clupeoides]
MWMLCALEEGTGPINYTWEQEGQDGAIRTLAQSNSSLFNIPWVARNLTGRYRCLAKNQVNQQWSDQTWIDIIYGPDVPYVDVTPYLLTEGGYAVMERETVTLSCQASSNPSSMYIWFYDNSQVNLGPRFTINKTLRVNSGQYTCQAQNSYLNRSSEKTIPLTVFYPPNGSPSCTILPTKNYTDLFLWCSWEGGYPPASLYWSFIPEKGVRQHSNATLILPGSETSNNSLFLCHGSHMALNSSSNCTTRTWHPQGDPQCYATGIYDNEFLKLSCSWEGGFPRALLWWTSSNGDIQGTSEESISILILRSNISYSGKILMCLAQHPLIKGRKHCVLRLEAPVLLTQHSVVSVYEGSDVQLSCFLNASYPATEITWYNNLKMPVGNMTSKYMVQNSINRSNLTIREADGMQDNGEYWCSAANALGRADMTILLKVKVPLSKPHITLSSSSPVEGTLVTMLCTLDKGTGPISYILEQESRDGVTTAGSASNYALFNISRITRNHTGWYWCLAKNDVSQQRSNRVWLDVIYGPDLPQIVTLLNVTEQGYLVLEKETVSLVCQAASNPPSQYVWLYNSSKVYVGSQLVIPKIQRMQTGQYGCLAQNMYLNSSTKMTINITVYYPPEGKPSCTILPANNYTDLTLWCSWDGGYPQASVYWRPYLQGKDGLGASRAILTIRGPDTANNSVFTCHGLHIAMNSTTNCSTRIWHPSGEPRCNANATHNNEYLTLSCSWEGGFPAALLWWASSMGDIQGKYENASVVILRANTSYSGKTFVCHAQHPLLAVRKMCILKLEAPVLVTQRSAISINEGNDLQLICQLNANYPATEVTWYNNLKQYTSNNTKKYIVQSTEDGSSLTIRMMDSLRDSGWYWCSASNSVGRAEVPILVTVKVPVSKPYVHLNTSSPEEGKSVLMVCKLDKGTGPINYIWEQQTPSGLVSTVAQGNSSVFNMTLASRKHTGWYRCLVDNDVNQEQSDRIWLNINFGPDLPNISVSPNSLTPQDYSILEKETVSFQCQAPSSPPSQYIWFYNNSQVYTGQQLTISSVLRDHTGHYTCLAQNLYLKTNSKNDITLTIYYPPDGSPSCSILPANNYTDLMLWCSWEGGKPQASLYWSQFLPGKDGWEVSNATLIQRGPDTANNSVFFCRGSHIALNSYKGCNTTTWYPPGEPQCFAYATRKNEFLMLSCLWEGGFPRALLWWTSNAGDIQGKSEENANILILRSSTAYSGKAFMCKAQHPLLPESKQCTLQLEAPVLVTQRSVVSVYEGSDIQLTCILRANYPTTDITWYNNLKQHVVDMPKKYLLQRAAAWSNLTVREADGLQDSGQYWCSATNAVGGAEIPILLVVKRYPMPPNVTISKIMYSSHQRSDIDLEWVTKTEGDLTGFIIEHSWLPQSMRRENSTIAWQTAATLQPDIRSFKIGGLDPAGLYTFRIKAVNHRTIGHPSQPKTPADPAFSAYAAVIGAAAGGVVVAAGGTALIFMYIMRSHSNIQILCNMLFRRRRSESQANIHFSEEDRERVE